MPKVKAYINEIIKAPSPTSLQGVSWNPKGLAKHNSLVTSAAESYAKAKGWPNTKASIEAARQILDRGTLETDSDYHKRLEEMKDILDSDVIEAKETLGNTTPHANEEKKINGVLYKKINGEWHSS